MRSDRAKKWVAALGVLALCALGCDPPGRKQGNARDARLAFITNGDSSFWDAAEKGLGDYCASKNRTFVFLRNKTGDSAGQIRLVDQVIAQPDIQGVAISVYEASAVGLIDRLRQLRSSGVAVITVDSDVRPQDTSARRAYIGTNNLEAGKAAGKVANFLLPKGGKALGFVGSLDADNARARVEGFKSAAPTVQLLDVFQDTMDKSKARSNVKAALAKSKDIDLLFGIYSYNAPAIAEEVAAANRRDHLKVLTFDAEVNTMKALANGGIDATIVQNTYDMGYKTGLLLDLLRTNNEKETEALLRGGDQLDTGVRIIVPDNSPLEGKDPRIESIGEFENYMRSKGLKST